MTNLELWNKVREIYFESSLATLRKEFFRWSNFKQTWYYIISLVLLCIIIPLIIIAMANKEIGYLANLLQIVSALIIFNQAHKKTIKCEVKKYQLQNYGFFEKARFLKYARFHELCIVELEVTPNRLAELLDWHKVYQSKFDVIKKFIDSKLIIIIFGAIYSFMKFISPNSLFENITDSNYSVWIYGCIILLFIVYFAYDLSKSNQRKDFEITKFLKMYLLETSQNVK